MRAIASAFGRDYRYPRVPLEQSAEFYGMPVANVVAGSTQLAPDLAPFVFNETVVMDGGFYERLTTSPTAAYREIANFYQAAFDANRLTLVDFESVLQREKSGLDEMLAIDVENIEPWLPRVIESLQIWDSIIDNSLLLKQQIAAEGYQRHFSIHKERSLRHAIGIHGFRVSPGHFGDVFLPYLELDENGQEIDLYKALLYKSHRRTKQQRAALKAFIESRLAYVNANIVLAQHYGASLYDWSDFSPFYIKKFRQVRQNAPTETDAKSHLSLLFSLLFPSHRIENYGAFFRCLDDKRVSELRDLCKEAALGNVQFDEAFATSIWKEQLQWSEKQRDISRRLSWWTLPANAIPVIGSGVAFGLQKAGEKLASSKNPIPHPWLFVFSDVFCRQQDAEG